MHVISSFDHSIYLELAINAVEEEGILKKNILVVPLEKPKLKPKMLDSMHRSDGISVLDLGVATATAFTVVGSSYGFTLTGGPVLWGIAGAVIGFIVGVIIDLLIKRKKPNKHAVKGKTTEVFVIVDCCGHQAERIESIFWEHHAFGVAKLENK